jgi:hypothetical protein
MWQRSTLNGDKMVPVPCERNGKDKGLEHNFPKICRYLNFVKIQRI